MTTGFIHANTCKYLVGNYRKLGPKIANCFGHPQNNFELTVKASSLLDLCLQGLLETAVVRVFHFLKLGFVCVCVCVCVCVRLCDPMDSGPAFSVHGIS